MKTPSTPIPSFDRMPFEIAALREDVRVLTELTRQVLSEREQSAYLPEILCSEDAARMLGLSKLTIYDMTSKKSLPHIKKGGKLYFERAELLAWVRSGEHCSATSDATPRRRKQKQPEQVQTDSAPTFEQQPMQTAQAQDAPEQTEPTATDATPSVTPSSPSSIPSLSVNKQYHSVKKRDVYVVRSPSFGEAQRYEAKHRLKKWSGAYWSDYAKGFIFETEADAQAFAEDTIGKGDTTASE